MTEPSRGRPRGRPPKKKFQRGSRPRVTSSTQSTNPDPSASSRYHSRVEHLSSIAHGIWPRPDSNSSFGPDSNTPIAEKCQFAYDIPVEESGNSATDYELHSLMLKHDPRKAPIEKGLWTEYMLTGKVVTQIDGEVVCTSVRDTINSICASEQSEGGDSDVEAVKSRREEDAIRYFERVWDESIGPHRHGKREGN
ncbi:uncharacterized protein L203_105906 [Cryptococcus depauperatus CBS 7841]|uniref:Uncharacterized protein n=1 Tax=Cryptococcus depauperatus CBS 7841 TaxID=1295531 RepID=A0A1E3HJ37_9TREE|nr:hypothetical protein L203_06420 [Cryptococcus depauperatus CBS 7841]